MGNGHADDYFDRRETGYRQCCSGCRFDVCTKNCDKSSGCKVGFSSWDVTCPTVYANGGLGIDYFNTDVLNVTYTLTDSDGFYSAISNDYGVDKDWIKFGNLDIKATIGCQFAGEDVKACNMMYNDWLWNYPGPADDIKVFNPKAIVEKSLGNFAELLDRLRLMRSIGDLDAFLSMTDVADAASVPAWPECHRQHGQGGRGGEGDREARAPGAHRRLPRRHPLSHYLRRGALDVGLVAIRTGLRTAEAGEAALLAFTVVQDPDNAFEAVFSTLAGAGLSRGSWTKAAKERRGGEEDSKKLGTIHDDLSKIGNIRGGVCRL